jgi:hypothetical protein
MDEDVKKAARGMVPGHNSPDRAHGLSRDPLWTFYVDDARAALTAAGHADLLAEVEELRAQVDLMAKDITARVNIQRQIAADRSEARSERDAAIARAEAAEARIERVEALLAIWDEIAANHSSWLVRVNIGKRADDLRAALAPTEGTDPT